MGERLFISQCFFSPSPWPIFPISLSNIRPTKAKKISHLIILLLVLFSPSSRVKRCFLVRESLVFLLEVPRGGEVLANYLVGALCVHLIEGFSFGSSKVQQGYVCLFILLHVLLLIFLCMDLLVEEDDCFKLPLHVWNMFCLSIFFHQWYQSQLVQDFSTIFIFSFGNVLVLHEHFWGMIVFKNMQRISKVSLSFKFQRICNMSFESSRYVLIHFMFVAWMVLAWKPYMQNIKMCLYFMLLNLVLITL